jgi:predicted alpha/beta superfamily hydrolase
MFSTHRRSCRSVAKAQALVVISFLIAASAPASTGPEDGAAISSGIYRRVHSAVLHEDRTLLIRLPEDYGATDKKFPVLYKLDGAKTIFLQTAGAIEYLADWQLAPDHIVVAIENTDRNRDMMPERGAADFVRFLREELIPFVDTNYRTNGFRILCGQSLSSVFALYAFLREPDTFDGYVLSSFGLSAEWLGLFERELGQTPARGTQRRYLFLSNGKLDSYDPDGARARNGLRFIDSLRVSRAAVLQIKHRVYEDEGHVPFPTIHDALKWIYAPRTDSPH